MGVPGKETLPRTMLLAGRNKDTRQKCRLVGEKPGSRRETRHQDQNARSGGEGGAWAGTEATGTGGKATPTTSRRLSKSNRARAEGWFETPAVNEDNRPRLC